MLARYTWRPVLTSTCENRCQMVSNRRLSRRRECFDQDRGSRSRQVIWSPSWRPSSSPSFFFYHLVLPIPLQGWLLLRHYFICGTAIDYFVFLHGHQVPSSYSGNFHTIHVAFLLFAGVIVTLSVWSSLRWGLFFLRACIVARIQQRSSIITLIFLVGCYYLILFVGDINCYWYHVG